MFDELKQLYLDSGFWAQPILLTTLALMVAWTVMMFTVRMIKRFVIFSVIAFLLPNAMGLVGYIEKAGDVKEAIVERGEEIKGELKKPLEDIEFSPLYLGLIGSAVTVVLGVVGVARVHRKNRSETKSDEKTEQKTSHQ
jgi:hypothetical protein